MTSILSIYDRRSAGRAATLRPKPAPLRSPGLGSAQHG
jgi:hypothetical protein